MDYKNNGNGSWTWYCQHCDKEEIVLDPNKPKKIKSFTEWCAKLLPTMELSWFERARMGEWMDLWGGDGLCKRCAMRRIDFCLDHPSPAERELA